VGGKLVCLAGFEQREQFHEHVLGLLQLLDDCRAVHYRDITLYSLGRGASAERYSSSLWLKCSVDKIAQRSIDSQLPEEEEESLHGNPCHQQKRACRVDLQSAIDCMS
jgi:hypothetical protein